MKTIYTKLSLAVISLVVLSACSKQSDAPVALDQNNGQKQLIIRIKQVEKDSTVLYSPKIRVQLRNGQ